MGTAGVVPEEDADVAGLCVGNQVLDRLPGQFIPVGVDEGVFPPHLGGKIDVVAQPLRMARAVVLGPPAPRDPTGAHPTEVTGAGTRQGVHEIRRSDPCRRVAEDHHPPRERPRQGPAGLDTAVSPALPGLWQLGAVGGPSSRVVEPHPHIPIVQVRLGEEHPRLPHRKQRRHGVAGRRGLMVEGHPVEVELLVGRLGEPGFLGRLQPGPAPTRHRKRRRLCDDPPRLLVMVGEHIAKGDSVRRRAHHHVEPGPGLGTEREHTPCGMQAADPALPVHQRVRSLELHRLAGRHELESRGEVDIVAHHAEETVGDDRSPVASHIEPEHPGLVQAHHHRVAAVRRRCGPRAHALVQSLTSCAAAGHRAAGGRPPSVGCGGSASLDPDRKSRWTVRRAAR